MIKLVNDKGEEALCDCEEQVKVMESLGFKKEGEKPKKKAAKKKAE